MCPGTGHLTHRAGLSSDPGSQWIGLRRPGRAHVERPGTASAGSLSRAGRQQDDAGFVVLGWLTLQWLTGDEQQRVLQAVRWQDAAAAGS
jgi:hypothetical protein